MDSYGSYLAHHGVLGMKWGVRRYQDENGRLTPAGKRRLDRISNKSQKPKYNDAGDLEQTASNMRKAKNAINDAVSDDYKNAVSGLNAASQTSDGLSRMSKKSASKSHKKKMSKIDVSDMSDKELQQYVNRMRLESQYKDLKASEITTGRDRAADFLDSFGDLLAVGASATSIMLAIHMMRQNTN